MESLGLAARLGITIVVLLLSGLGAGFGLDKWLDTSPVFTLIGAMVGMGWSLWALFRLTKDFREPLRKRPEEEK